MERKLSQHISKFIDAMSAKGCAPAKISDVRDTGGEQKLIRSFDDRNGSKSLYFSYKNEGDRSIGTFHSCKLSIGDIWFSKSNKEWTDEEKKEWAKKRTGQREEEARKLRDGYEAVAEAATELWKRSTKAKEHPYLTKKGIKGDGCRIHEGDLLVPLRDIEGKLWLLQTITPEGQKYNSFRLPDGSWAKGGKKQGCYHGVVNGKTDKSVICVAEGYATGRSIAEATGLAVVVAVDSGNLRPVAEAMKKKYPDATIIIGADNDQWRFKEPRPAKLRDIKRSEIPGDDERWSEWRDAGLLQNQGREKAEQAAAKVSGYSIYPDIPPGDVDKRTDFNDTTPDEIMERFAPVVEQARKPEKEETPPDFHSDEQIIDEVRNVDPDEDDVGDLGLPLDILGHNDGNYYYFPYCSQQIVCLTASNHASMAQLYRLCDLDTWMERLGGNISENKIPNLAANMLMKESHRKPVFHNHGMIRGSGAWLDGGRFILHCGDRLIIDGQNKQLKDGKGKYVYAASPEVYKPHSEALTDEEAIKLKKICEMPSWELALSGVLLAGWIVIAPVCAALDWRPHIWMTGEAGSGKSTIIKKIIRPAVGDPAVNLDGGTTEAAIRKRLGYQARPVIYDEGGTKPGQNKFNNAMEGIISLARNASQGANISKVGQNDVDIRTCFCFGGVHPPITSLQDETRNTMMSLKKSSGADAHERFMNMVRIIDQTITPEYSRKLLKRTIDNIGTLLENVKIFKKVAFEAMKDSRSADQIAPMLAGYCLLHNTDIVQEDTARQMVSEYSWIEHTTVSVKSDPERLLHYIATAAIPIRSIGSDMTLGNLIVSAITTDNESPIGIKSAKSLLANYSIKVTEGSDAGVDIGSSNQNMEKLLRDTEWVRGYKKMLSRLEGTKDISSTRFGPGDRQRAVRLPFSYFLDDGESYQSSLSLDEEEIEIPFD